MGNKRVEELGLLGEVEYFKEMEFEEMKTGGVKHTVGKNRLDLIPPEMIIGLGEVLTYGTAKYSERNWERGLPFMTSYGAAMRHLMHWAGGIDIDRESGLKHIDMAMINLGMIATQTRRGRRDLDDRPKKKAP